jgi:hypothetical protein
MHGTLSCPMAGLEAGTINGATVPLGTIQIAPAISAHSGTLLSGTRFN